MLADANDIREPYVPTEADALVAREATRQLEIFSRTTTDIRVQILDTDSHITVPLPSAAVRFFIEILHNMAEGLAFTLMPMHAELTTQEAADFLNVSRPHVVRLLENGAIPFHKAGTHRRVRFADLDTYKRNSDMARRKVLDDMVAASQELGLE